MRVNLSEDNIIDVSYNEYDCRCETRQNGLGTYYQFIQSSESEQDANLALRLVITESQMMEWREFHNKLSTIDIDNIRSKVAMYRNDELIWDGNDYVREF